MMNKWDHLDDEFPREPRPLPMRVPKHRQDAQDPEVDMKRERQQHRDWKHRYRDPEQE